MLDIGGTRATARRLPTPDRGSSPAEAPCDLVTVPAREGLEAVDILRLRSDVGPVLHDREGDTLGFLVPPGTAERWELAGSACTQTYGSACGTSQPPVTGTGWLVPPDGTRAQATRPDALRAALNEAARTLAAADRSPY